MRVVYSFFYNLFLVSDTKKKEGCLSEHSCVFSSTVIEIRFPFSWLPQFGVFF